jgi:hypothetical protein
LQGDAGRFTDIPRMWLQLPALHEARSLVGREQTILNQLCDSVDGGFVLFVRTPWIVTKGGVGGVYEVVFHGDRDASVE